MAYVMKVQQSFLSTLINPLMARRYLIEMLGTFAYVFFGVGARILIGYHTDLAGRLVIYLIFGLALATMGFAFHTISSAAFNPAITLGLAAAKRFPWRYVLPYWLAQCAGAILASSFHLFLLPPALVIANKHGASIPHIGLLQATCIEAMITFFYMLICIAVATEKRFDHSIGQFARGAGITCFCLFAAPLSGGSLNPARSLGPAIFVGGSLLADVWIYWLGPCVGAILAAWLYEMIREGKENALEAPVGIFEGIRKVPLPKQPD